MRPTGLGPACLSFQHRRDPAKQPRQDFSAVDLIEHFTSSTQVKIVRDVADACFVIALNQDLGAFELLTHGIFAARKQVDGQVGAYLAKTDRIGQSPRSSEKRCIGRGLKLCKTQWSLMNASTTALSRLNQSNRVRARSGIVGA